MLRDFLPIGATVDVSEVGEVSDCLDSFARFPS